METTFLALSNGKCGRIFSGRRYRSALFRPGADGIAKIEKLVAVNFGARPAGFCGQDIGEFLAFIEQEIPQPVEQSRALGEAGLLPSSLGPTRPR